jgi:epoxyqueuosine reductase
MMYRVLESYRRFDQKNNLVCRPHWDPSLRDLVSLQGKTQLRKMEAKIPGFGLEDFALAAAGQLVASSFGTDINIPNAGLKSWQPIPVSRAFTFPDMKPAVADVPAMTHKIKRVARYFGADLVGIAKLDLRWVYSHHYIPETGESRPVEIGESYTHVITMAVGEDYSIIQTAPSALYMAETFLTYSRMALLVGSLAQFIRQLGYRAIPSLNDTALNVPLALDAGLGQFGRHGLLITPQFGPRQRICKVITDLPLQADTFLDFGVSEFCSVCFKCAEKCPSKAISFGTPTAEVSSISTNPGVMKWPILGERCWEYRLRNFGTNCGICVRVCPFNKSRNGLHSVPRWLIKHAPWLDRPLRRLDDLLGYGKYSRPDISG